jgi:LmbE family N-acetylglucosaminyl deacetylase
MSEQQTSNATPGVAMVVMAHPDDAEFGCAGTVAGWVNEGWEVYYVLCTDAASGGPDEAVDVSPEARRTITETRKAEQRAAGKVLGPKDVFFLDLPDGTLEPTLDLRRELVRFYRTYRPTRLICQSPERAWKPVMAIGRHHPDHLAAGAAAIAAMYPASQNPWDFPELLAEGLQPHKIKELYVMGAPEVNHAVDISATFETKLAALRAHESQVGARWSELETRMREWAKRGGEPYGFDAAEVFHRSENP